MDDETEAWKNFVKAAGVWSGHLDQWDKFKFETEYGLVYVSIGRQDPYPDSFDLIDIETGAARRG